MTPETPPPPARRRRGLLIGVLVLVVAGGAGAYFLLAPHPPGGAVVVFHLSPPQPLLERPPSDPADFEAFCQSQAQLVTSRRVLNAAMNDPKVRDLSSFRDLDRLAWLTENLRVTVDPPSRSMRVVLTGEPPEEMVLILTAVTKAYLVASREMTPGGARVRIAELGKYLETLRVELKEYHRRLDDIATELGASDAKTLSFQYDDLGREYQACGEALRRLRHDLAVLEAGARDERDADRQGALAAVGVRPTHPVVPLNHPRQRAENSLARKRLLTEETLWMKRLLSVNETRRGFNVRMREVDEIQRETRGKEALADQLAVEIERCRIELKAPPRVMLIDEVAPLQAP